MMNCLLFAERNPNKQMPTIPIQDPSPSLQLLVEQVVNKKYAYKVLYEILIIPATFGIWFGGPLVGHSVSHFVAAINAGTALFLRDGG